MLIRPLDNSDKLTGIVLQHNGQELYSEGSIFDRTPFPNTGELFMDINAFWATLPQETQDRIWKIYNDIEYTFLNTFNDVMLNDAVTDLVGQLYACWDYKELSSFVRLYCNVVLPPDVQSSMGEYPPEGTYLQSDYLDLICLITAMRPLIPIWNRYVRETRRSVGTHFKEFRALGLLNKTPLIDTPEYHKLVSYVNRNVDTSKITLAALVNGIGSSELEVWILGVVLVRKVCVGVVMHVRPDGRLISDCPIPNIISNVFRQIETAQLSLDRKFDGQVRKKPEGSDFRDEDKDSTAEKILVKQPINDFKFLLAWKYAKGISNIRERLDPTLPPNWVDWCINNLNRMPGFVPNAGQMALVQWAINHVLAARFIPSLEQAERNNIFGIAQALYWHWGFPDLALMVTATPVLMDDDSVLTVETRSRVTNEQFRILKEQYPYYHQRTGVKRDEGEQQRNENAAMIAIDKLFSLFDGSPYNFNAPKTLKDLTTMRPFTQGGFLLPSDFKVQVANFIIKLNRYKGEANDVH